MREPSTKGRSLIEPHGVRIRRRDVRAVLRKERIDDTHRRCFAAQVHSAPRDQLDGERLASFRERILRHGYLDELRSFARAHPTDRPRRTRVVLAHRGRAVHRDPVNLEQAAPRRVERNRHVRHSRLLQYFRILHRDAAVGVHIHVTGLKIAVLRNRRRTGLRIDVRAIPRRSRRDHVRIAARRRVVRHHSEHNVVRRSTVRDKPSAVLHADARVLRELHLCTFRNRERHAVRHRHPVAHHVDRVVAPDGVFDEPPLLNGNPRVVAHQHVHALGAARERMPAVGGQRGVPR